MLDLRPPLATCFDVFGVATLATPAGGTPVDTTAVVHRVTGPPGDVGIGDRALSLVGDVAVNELRNHVVMSVALLLADVPKFPAGSTVVLGSLDLDSDADVLDLDITDGVLTVLDFAALTGATVTVTVDDQDFDLVEGVDWPAGVSDEITAATLAIAIRKIPGLTAVAVGDAVTVALKVWEVFYVLDQDDEQIKVLVK